MLLKITDKIISYYPRKCFLTKEIETRVEFNPGLSANWPSNNWTQYIIFWIKAAIVVPAGISPRRRHPEEAL